MKKKIAVVTGGNRGLGLEASRQLAKKGYEVILTARDEKKGMAAVDSLKREGLDVKFHPLDVTDTKSIQALARDIERDYGRLDVLVNNAGVLLENSREGRFDGKSAFKTEVSALRETLETNVYGPYQLCQLLIPLMQKNRYGRVVNVSSGMGQLSDMSGGYPAYRVSKTALNALTRIFADETSGSGVLVNSICPGWVKTDMGGAGAELTPEQGADTIVWAATLPDDGPTGGFFREREAIEW